MRSFWFTANFLLAAESGKSEVYVTTFPPGGGKWQVSSSGGWLASWRSNELFYGSSDFTMMVVKVATGATFEAGIPVPLFKADRSNGGDITEDGQRILLSYGASSNQDVPITLVTNWTAALPR